MKNIKFFVLPVLLAFVIVSCDRESGTVIHTITQETGMNKEISTDFYTQLTHHYLATVDDGSNPPDQLEAPRKFWSKLWKGIKQFLNADANAMLSIYKDSQNLVGTLVLGVGSSIDEITKNEKITIDSGLPDLQVLKEAVNLTNRFDSIGYNHYVIVNKVLNNMDEYNGITDVGARDAAIIQSVKKEVLNLYPNAQIGEDIDYTTFYNFLKLQHGESYTEDSIYYDRIFSSTSKKTDPTLLSILQLYARSYEAVKEGYIDSFIAYSKKMEQAVLEDNKLTTDVKETLLIRMATYRYGIKYYASLN
ncbi:hypothetical protein [Myroides sp. DF42-4-2]|uniref:hypothetical protein n=1 Tax=unclassified Myroides TaxID=2642485 RepID=UPI002578A123|nr:hypothetical protein [Myroides sp. DF42-4-2]